MIFSRVKTRIYLLLVIISFGGNVAFAQQKTLLNSGANTLDPKAVEQFRKATHTLISVTKDRILVNKHGQVIGASLHNFFLKNKRFPLVLLLRINNKEGLLTYESCMNVPSSNYLSFLRGHTQRTPLIYKNMKSFLEFSEQAIGKKLNWVTICMIDNRMKFAQIGNIIDWPKVKIKNTIKTTGDSVSRWTWQNHKISSMLIKNGEFISFW